MAFGWAYVDCEGSTGGGQAAGPTGSVQFLTGANATSGSTSFLFYTSSYTEHTANTLVLSGNLVVTGAISASHYRINNVTIIESTGSTFFGDTNDDIHIRTGSLYVGPTGGGTADVLRVDVSSKAVEVRGFNVEYTPVTVSKYTASAPTYILGVQRTGVVSILIPSASVYGTGSILLVKDEVGHTDGTDITINASAGYTIDGTTNYVLTGSNPAISLYSNGANWFVF